MAAIGQSGILGFGPQFGKGAAVPTDAWCYHRADNVDLGVTDDQRVGPPEVGGRPLPTLPYKAGVMGAGGFTINPRLEGSMGWLLYAMQGTKRTAVAAVAHGRVMAAKAVTAALQTITTGLSNPPTGGAKLAVRILRADYLAAYKPTITIIGTDTSDQALTETFNFGAALAADQRAVGLDTDPSSATGYETIVGAEVFKTVTSVAIPAYADVGSEAITVEVGHEDATAKQHDFLIDDANPSLVKWLGFRKYIPPGDNGIGLGETFVDGKILQYGMVFPNDGLVTARVEALSRLYSHERNPTWVTAAMTSFEDYQSVPISTVLGGYIRAPFFAGDLSVVNAQFAWANQNLDLRMEKVYGSPYLEDVTIVGRQLMADITVKYVNPDVYQAALSNSKLGTEWSSTPFTTRMDVITMAPGLIPSSLVPYSLRVQAQKMMLSMRGPIVLAGNNAIIMRFTGTALDVGGVYALYSLVNAKTEAYYTWPAA